MSLFPLWSLLSSFQSSPFCLLPLPGELVLFFFLFFFFTFVLFFQGEGGEEGGESKILSPRRRELRLEKGQKQGRQKLYLH